MKKLFSILFSVLFSIFILIIGTGVNVVKCNHTGNIKLTFLGIVYGTDFTCNPAHSCMESNFYKFLPNVDCQVQSFEFQHFDAIKPIVLEEYSFVDDTINYSVCNQNFRLKSPPNNIYIINMVFRI